MRSIFTGEKVNILLEVSIILLVAGFSLLLLIIGLSIIIKNERPLVKCPNCKNKQFDSSYNAQTCNNCSHKWEVKANDF